MVDVLEVGNEALEATAEQFNSPLQSSPVECSTAHKPVHDNSATPPGPTKRKISINLKMDSKEREIYKEPIVHRSDRIKTAMRV